MDEVTNRTRVAQVSKISDRVAEGAACLIVCASVDPMQVGRRHELSEKAVTIGRSPDSTVIVESETVSRSHARIERRGRGFVLVDCGSVNGTYLGDERNRPSNDVLRQVTSAQGVALRRRRRHRSSSTQHGTRRLR